MYLCTLDNVWLGCFYDARSAYGIFQVVQGHGVRAMRRSMPIIIIDMLQLAFLGHISCEDNTPVQRLFLSSYLIHSAFE